MQAQLGKQARLGHSSSNRPAISGPAPRRALSHFAPAKANASNEPSTSSSLSSVDIDPDALLRASPSSAARSLAGPAEWFDTAPRVRVRPADARQMEVLVELAVLNERLSGSLQPWEARRKLEYLRTKRKNWERIFAYITSQELDATLAVIEEANRKVEESFNAEARDRTGVGALRNQLQALQTDISTAQARLTATQAAVEAELARVTELRREAENLERLRSGTLASTSSSTAAVAPIASDSASATLAPPVQREATCPRTVPQPRPEQQQQQQQQAPKPQRKAVASTAAPNRRRALHSSIKLEEPLKNFWYACEFSSRLPKDTLVPIELFGEPWVLFRDAQGKASCIRDECAHRACPLSIGKIEQGEVVCPYHGWTYDGSGSCNKMPSTRHCKGVSVKALTCVEKDGFIWVWPGKMPEGGEEALPEIPNTLPPEGYEIHAEICVDVPVEHGLLVENLLDLAHAPFTHQTTFARGWPVPDVVKFHTEKALWGHWDPYPIDMGFLPPCMTVSLIGLDKPGQVARGARALACKNHLHQLHVCLPSKPGHTRLLYRMSLDFIPWLRHVPFIDKVWKNVAGQVLGEDLVLVIGQQDRMQRGGNTWAFPVSYDKIAVRYRRWRNEVEAAGSARRAGDDAAAAAAFERAAALAASASLVSAGQLFASDQEDEVIAEVHAERARAKTGEL